PLPDAVGAAVIRMVGLPLGAVVGLSVRRVPGQSAKRSEPAMAARAWHWVWFTGRRLLRPKSRMAFGSGLCVRGLCSCSTATALMVRVTDRPARSSAFSHFDG